MSENYIEKYKNIQHEALSLFEKKNTDYGDSFANDGIIGVLVRLGDKIQRLKHITQNGITLVNDETLRDTLLDLHNYSAMAIMLLNSTLHKQIEPNIYQDQGNSQILLK